MKLRIKGNALRLRVTRSELARLLRGERVEETIQFSAAPESRLTYGLQSARQSKPIEIVWKPQRVTVLLAEDRMRLWGSESEVGVYEAVETGPGSSLAVTIEKDFACLDRDDEENADSFTNPKATCR